MNLQIINPLDYPHWDELLLTNENCSFFHSSSWARVLCESYKYKPLYFTSIKNDELLDLISVMGIQSLLTGRRGVSLPFTDYCQPIISDKSHFKEVLDDLIAYGKKAGWKYIEWRGGEDFFQDKIHSSFYYGHTLNLKQNEKELLSRFRSSTKRNINKAVKEGVVINICDSLESVKQFYRLNCITRKHHGLPPQPFYFFKKIYEHIISKKKGFVVLASLQQKIISGAVYFYFKNKAVYKYGASDRRYQQLRANNLVMWEAIKWFGQNEFKEFSFGRTEAENSGLLQFKRGWGTEESTISYYKYDLINAAFVKDRSSAKTSYALFKNMPSPLLNLAGTLLYRHVG